MYNLCQSFTLNLPHCLGDIEIVLQENWRFDIKTEGFSNLLLLSEIRGKVDCYNTEGRQVGLSKSIFPMDK